MLMFKFYKQVEDYVTCYRPTASEFIRISNYKKDMELKFCPITFD